MTLQFLIVVGGSFVGTKAAQQLAANFHGRFRVLLIEKNSHFQHLFAFPRFSSAVSVKTQKAFIPYPGVFDTSPRGSVDVVQARVTSVTRDRVQLDRKVFLNDQHMDTIPYLYLVIATGTTLVAPSNMPSSEKLESVNYLQEHARRVKQSSNIVIIGGGAVGVQMATDIKELYPNKSVTLVHSRQLLMNKFHHKLHEIVEKSCADLSIKMVLGSRVKLPTNGYPTDGDFYVNLEDGSRIPSDMAIVCTGQIPQSDILRSLSPESIDASGFIRMAKTLQISNPKYPNVFAIGDVAMTGAHKAARPGGRQAEIVAKNIQHHMSGEPLEEYAPRSPPAIRLTLGINKGVSFRNPPIGSYEPVVEHGEDGQLDMNIDRVWARRGGGADSML
ncbi:hypothetical protein OIDMADRAFT_52805 [Oidiodendron maius Zn]|uniref:FAD/NAD(P)-binding domain-containing protein n=1 Tax=Oidiodendron maius (strain Zn) TaxID=913774 RepID=A0A0C3DLS2_OIDMZ|nr:hypothetical protein OIDMADRAFT_52805 [Oidiodendron maius Zn]